MEKWKVSKYNKDLRRPVSEYGVMDSMEDANHAATLLLNNMGEEGRKTFSVLLEPVK